MATNRTEKALLIPQVRVPDYFRHAVTLNKPIFSVAATQSLDSADLQRFQLWIVNRENGSLTGTEQANASPTLLDAMRQYEDYLNSPDYMNWSAVDNAARETQYRLFIVDIVEAINAKATIPISQDPFGGGANPIAPSDVGILGGTPEVPPTEFVTTGGVISEMVFGDDGDTVTVGP